MEERDNKAEEKESSKEDNPLEKKEETVTTGQAQEDNTDVKKTFGNIDKKVFRDTITIFKKLSSRRGNNGVSRYPRYQKIFWLTEKFN